MPPTHEKVLGLKDFWDRIIKSTGSWSLDFAKFLFATLNCIDNAKQKFKSKLELADQRLEKFSGNDMHVKLRSCWCWCVIYLCSYKVIYKNIDNGKTFSDLFCRVRYNCASLAHAIHVHLNFGEEFASHYDDTRNFSCRYFVRWQRACYKSLFLNWNWENWINK